MRVLEIIAIAKYDVIDMYKVRYPSYKHVRIQSRTSRTEKMVVGTSSLNHECRSLKLS